MKAQAYFRSIGRSAAARGQRSPHYGTAAYLPTWARHAMLMGWLQQKPRPTEGKPDGR